MAYDIKSRSGCPLQDQPLEWEQKARLELQFNREPAAPEPAPTRLWIPQLPGPSCMLAKQSHAQSAGSQLNSARPTRREPQPRDTANTKSHRIK